MNLTHAAALLVWVLPWIGPEPLRAAGRQKEALGRGLVAVRTGDSVAVSWRMLESDSSSLGFHLYRQAGSSAPVRVTEAPLMRSTHQLDKPESLEEPLHYFLRPVQDGMEGGPTPRVRLDPGNAGCLTVPLQTLPGYAPNDGSVGDLDGDGEYEIVLHQAGQGRDNSQRGMTAEPLLEAYTLSGRLLWRIRLGRNIREGAHYTQFIVYDLDGDGRAEVACKTADGTVDGTGRVLGDPEADHRNAAGYILSGPEFLTVFDGQTGAALASVPYLPPRGRVADWGDDYGNRVDRFLACVAYLDGERPSLVMCRGYYTRSVLVAWNWRRGSLQHLWTFDSHDGTPGNLDYAGQGAHSLSVGDVDGDGRDEIVYGGCVIDDNGRGLYSTRLGHGDALHLSDFDPQRPGMEIFFIHERATHPHGVELHDARTGALLWSKPSPDVGRGLAADIDPRHPGAEMWAAGAGLSGLWNCRGELISSRRPRSCNFAVWWDGDLLRELLDGTTISKWNWEQEREEVLLSAEGAASNNGSKSTPVLCADLLGDWREEVIWRSRNNRELRIYTTPIPTRRRMTTLMHDSQYRLSVAWQNVGYNQPAHPGFFLGEDMPLPPRKSEAEPR